MFWISFLSSSVYVERMLEPRQVEAEEVVWGDWLRHAATGADVYIKECKTIGDV